MSLENKVSKMIKKYIILSDAHLTTEATKDYSLVTRKFLPDFKPHGSILLGDWMDVSALSAWDMDKRLLMEGRRWKAELNFANKEMDYLQSKGGDIIYLEGNHEDRVTRYVQKNPEMEGLMEIPERLDLKGRGVEWVPMNELYKVGSLYATHGMYTNMNHAKKHLQMLGCNIVYGHQHGTQTAMQNMKMQKPHMAYALGTLGEMSPSYMKGKPGNWISQFATLYVDTKTGNFNLYPVNIINHAFVYGGKRYESKRK